MDEAFHSRLFVLYQTTWLAWLTYHLPPPPYFPVQSPIEQVQTQVDQLSKEVNVLMEKSSRIEELLMKMVAKRGIHQDDTGEAEMQ